MKNKDRKAKLSSAYHEFSIHRRLFWLVSFLRFAIPCCDFPHDELSWRKSWDDDLNLEVIQQLYILTASFAPEHRINIQWNQSCQHDRRHLLFSRVSNEIQGISNRIVRMRDISLLCCVKPERVASVRICFFHSRLDAGGGWVIIFAWELLGLSQNRGYFRGPLHLRNFY